MTLGKVEVTHPDNCDCWICEYTAQEELAFHNGTHYGFTEIADFYAHEHEMSFGEGTSKLLIIPLDDTDTAPF